ncbi:hypothetical protein Acor_80830 [Acrocarpospora corrugata]|uniref:Uncharacterized protein n=1 Tax=Acrocarpospora corrugata TaxID=35763 RepID=A0A5M3WAR7_9ACTN|nr:hypothetical protein [Acrocarpospora corrugata]GES06014.1 hypothetical protein Acor_80830 [Acrocarpospora corrugata]
MSRGNRARREGEENGRIDLSSAAALGETDGRDPQYVDIADQTPQYPPRGLAEIFAQVKADLCALIEGRDERVSTIDRTAAEKYVTVENLLNRKLEINRELQEIEERIEKLRRALPGPGPQQAATGQDQWGVELERIRIDRRKILTSDGQIRHAVPDLVSWIKGADVDRRQAHRQFLSQADSVLEHAKALVAAYLHGFNRRHPRRERLRAGWHPAAPELPAEGTADLPAFSVDLDALRELWHLFLWLYRRSD